MAYIIYYNIILIHEGAELLSDIYNNNLLMHINAYLHNISMCSMPPLQFTSSLIIQF